MTKRASVFMAVMLFGPLALELHAETLTLGDVERRAVTQAFEARAQHFEERSKAWAKRRAIAEYMPSVRYTTTYLRMYEKTVEEANRAFESMFPPSVPMPRNPNRLYEDSFSHEISVNQPITNGGAEIISIRMAELGKKAAQLQQEAVKQEVIYSARKAYFDALAAAERTAVARQSLAWSKQNLERSRTRHEAGAVPYTDLLQWEAEVVQKESDLVAAEALERSALLALFQAMGYAPHEADTSIELLPLETFEQWYQKGPASMVGSVEGSPQLQAIRTLTKVAKELRNLALSGFLPKVNVFYAYSWQAWDKLKPQDYGKGWTAGVVLDIPLFAGTRNSANYRESQYNYLKGLVEERRVHNQFEVNLERIALMYGAAYQAVKAAHKQHELMDKQLAIMQKRYDGGQVNQSQLLEVALGVEQTRIGYIQKLLECLLLEAEQLRATGKLEVTP